MMVSLEALLSVLLLKLGVAQPQAVRDDDSIVMQDIRRGAQTIHMPQDIGHIGAQ